MGSNPLSEFTPGDLLAELALRDVHVVAHPRGSIAAEIGGQDVDTALATLAEIYDPEADDAELSERQKDVARRVVRLSCFLDGDDSE